MNTPSPISTVHHSESPRRVVVVDNDPVMRAGTASILSGANGVELVAAVDHDTGRAWTEQWKAVDVAVVDASDPRRRIDQFPGVAVVRSIRELRRDLVVVVLTGQYLHPGLRHRMWEAGADFFYPRDEGMSEEELVSVVLRPSEHRRLRSSAESLPGDLGITPATRVNHLVDRLVAADLGAVLETGSRKKAGPHAERSRWWNHVRQLAGGADGLAPAKASGERAIHLDAPSIVQLRRFWATMTRAHPSSGEQPAE
jgi:CheY-like chemotaxis protein